MIISCGSAILVLIIKGCIDNLMRKCEPCPDNQLPAPNEERSCISLAISARHSCMDSPVDAMVYPQPASGWLCLHCDSARNGQQRNWLCRGNYPAPWWNLWQVWYCNNQRVPNDGPYVFHPPCGGQNILEDVIAYGSSRISLSPVAVSLRFFRSAI